ncbi:MAG: hypothetical protein QOJ59_2487, partial [Thermomicrobiales bacterium]|nr:hypothetical protein [Thermomicrobiales bacterium]
MDDRIGGRTLTLASILASDPSD